jgi:delta1-piperideine-2-carboxylate reductase
MRGSIPMRWRDGCDKSGNGTERTGVGAIWDGRKQVREVSLSLEEIGDLASRVFLSHGCDEANTQALVRTVVAAERNGALSHGLFRVPGYAASLKSGKVNGKVTPAIGYKTSAIVSVHGDNGYAPLAIERGVPALADAAKSLGVAVMAITHTYHFAALWPEVEAVAERGLIALASTCYMPCVAPYGGNKPLFGTNPFAFAWPRPDRDPVVIDMATSAMALGEVQIAAREGQLVPAGTGLDARGEPTLDPNEIVKGVLLPFGGYKGSALALVAELLSAGAIGERFSFEAAVADNRDGGPPRGGEFMLAVSPELLAGAEWATHCEGFFREFESIDGVRLPGSRRYKNRLSNAPRDVNAELLARIRALCS